MERPTDGEGLAADNCQLVIGAVPTVGLHHLPVVVPSKLFVTAVDDSNPKQTIYHLLLFRRFLRDGICSAGLTFTARRYAKHITYICCDNCCMSVYLSVTSVDCVEMAKRDSIQINISPRIV